MPSEKKSNGGMLRPGSQKPNAQPTSNAKSKSKGTNAKPRAVRAASVLSSAAHVMVQTNKDNIAGEIVKRHVAKNVGRVTRVTNAAMAASDAYYKTRQGASK